MELIIFRFDMLLETLPVNRSSTNVECGRVFSRPNARAVDDLLCIHGEEFVGEGIPDMVSETNHIAELLGGGARVGSVFALSVDLVPEREPEEDANVDSVASEQLKRDGPAKGLRGSEVHDEKDVSKGEKPARGVTSGAIHDVIGNTFDVLPATFTWILMLFVWFALPSPNVKVVEDDIDTFACFISGAVGEESVGCTAVTNVAL
jgi:hypothetical protein